MASDWEREIAESVRQTYEWYVELLGVLRERGTIPPATPADAHALQEQADRERRDFAWLHHCGHLNHGYWHPRNSCGGCRFSVEHADEVEGHYRLVEVEGLSDEEQA